MSCVNILNVTVLNNPVVFTAPLEFEISFVCTEPLSDDLEWKLTYVGSSESENFDQILDSVLVGPVPVGVNKFVFQCDPPDWTKIPPSEIVGVTVILLTCSYKNNEFLRIGYYVNNDYVDPELKENQPETPDITKIFRNIVSDQPRITTFPIDWT